MRPWFFVPFLMLLGFTAAIDPASGGPAAPPVNPPVFTNPLQINHPFHPFPVGGMKVYTGTDEGEKIVIVDLFTAEARAFVLNAGMVDTRVLQETEFADGRLVEISKNYFAQADDGTVYYFGEVVDDYEDGKIVGHGGSWLVGGPTLQSDPVDSGNAPQPAVFWPGNAERGESWKPEDLFPLVDETATLIGTNLRVSVPAGRFQGCALVRETSGLGPGREQKWYAPGFGVVKGTGHRSSFKLIAATF